MGDDNGFKTTEPQLCISEELRHRIIAVNIGHKSVPVHGIHVSELLPNYIFPYFNSPSLKFEDLESFQWRKNDPAGWGGC